MIPLRNFHRIKFVRFILNRMNRNVKVIPISFVSARLSANLNNFFFSRKRMIKTHLTSLSFFISPVHARFTVMNLPITTYADPHWKSIINNTLFTYWFKFKCRRKSIRPFHHKQWRLFLCIFYTFICSRSNNSIFYELMSCTDKKKMITATVMMRPAGKPWDGNLTMESRVSIYEYDEAYYFGMWYNLDSGKLLLAC